MSKMTKQQRQYIRSDKPPYSYVGLIALAIQSSPIRRMRLNEIIERLGEMFPTMKAGHRGWVDSVRHNLSKCKCFRIDYEMEQNVHHPPKPDKGTY